MESDQIESDKITLTQFHDVARSMITQCYYAGLVASAALFVSQVNWPTTVLAGVSAFLISDSKIGSAHLCARDIVNDQWQPLSKPQKNRIDASLAEAGVEAFMSPALTGAFTWLATKTLGLSAFSSLSSIGDPDALGNFITSSSWWAIPAIAVAGCSTMASFFAPGDAYENVSLALRPEKAPSGDPQLLTHF